MTSDTPPSSTQPITSLIAAALMAMAPARVLPRPVSSKILPRTGSAVMDIETAKISMKLVTDGRGSGSASWKYVDVTAPSANGITIPSTLTSRTARLGVATAENSKSSPIWNISRTSPTCANPLNTGPVLAAKMYANASGSSTPSRLGPSRIPASISPTTSACPKRLPIHATSRVPAMMTMSCSKMRCTADSDLTRH